MTATLLTLAGLKERVVSLLQHTRDIDDGELRTAVNFGYGKAIKAVMACRPEAFVSYADPFTLAAGVQEYDLSAYDPVIWRPFRLVAGVGGGTVATFRYRPLSSPQSIEDDLSGVGSGSGYAYDFLSGMLPGTPVTIASAVAGSVVVNSTTGFAEGTFAQVIGAGARVAFGSESYPGPWRGVITSIAGTTMTVEPDFTAVPQAGVAITPIRRRVMVVSPAPSSTLTGRLYYNYRPARLVGDTDVVDALVAEHEELIVWYALAIAGRAVGDSNASRWFEDAEGQRSELMQDLDPMAQDTEAVESDLWGMSDW